MRILHLLLRSGGITVLASLTIACNIVLGVYDVSPFKPDASICHINSDFPVVASNAATSSLTTF